MLRGLVVAQPQLLLPSSGKSCSDAEQAEADELLTGRDACPDRVSQEDVVLVRDVRQQDTGCGEMRIAIVDQAGETRLLDQLRKDVDYRPAGLSELFRCI